jgi:isochorismate synthase
MIRNQGWSLWREPQKIEIHIIHGLVESVTKLDDAHGGMFIHPFEGDTAYCIKGKPTLFLGDITSLTTFHAPFYPQDFKDDYLYRLENVVERMRIKSIEKIVFSRRKHLDRGPFSIEESVESFTKLAAAYPDSYVSLVSIPQLGTWLAATPEVLCHRKKDLFSTMALAGTRSSLNPSPWGSKEIREQALVSENISKALMTLGATEIMQTGPYTSITGTLHHLRTDFAFSGDFSLPRVARFLHPTPAVCGVPTDIAKATIAEFEPSKRDLYAGYLGYLPDIAEEDASLYVHLRCACLTSEMPVLFAGGGILLDSNLEQEWEETEQKLQVLIPYLKK